MALFSALPEFSGVSEELAQLWTGAWINVLKNVMQNVMQRVGLVWFRDKILFLLATQLQYTAEEESPIWLLWFGNVLTVGGVLLVVLVSFKMWKTILNRIGWLGPRENRELRELVIGLQAEMVLLRSQGSSQQNSPMSSPQTPAELATRGT